jgi:ABC-type multidrug transport system permease subunit
MAVAYIPAYIEDQATFFKERANGLCSPASFLVANFLIGLPYLALIAIIFSSIAYWLVNLWPKAEGFWVFVAFLFLDLLAAESLVVLVSSIVPNFVLSLALVAFAHGLWIGVNGFLVPETILNVFWRSWATKITYQNWVFRAMMWNEFHAQEFECDQLGVCAFPPGPDNITIPGISVLRFYGYSSGWLEAYACYILAITAAYRLIAWAVLTIRK